MKVLIRIPDLFGFLIFGLGPSLDLPNSRFLKLTGMAVRRSTTELVPLLFKIHVTLH